MATVLTLLNTLSMPAGGTAGIALSAPASGVSQVSCAITLAATDIISPSTSFEFRIERLGLDSVWRTYIGFTFIGNAALVNENPVGLDISTTGLLGAQIRANFINNGSALGALSAIATLN